MRPVKGIPPRGALVDRNHPLAKNLLAFWPLNEGTSKKAHGFAGDVSGQENHFDQWTSFTGDGARWSPGLHNLGLSIEHHNDHRCYVGTSLTGFLDTSEPFTVVSWINAYAWGNPFFQASVINDLRCRAIGTPAGALKVTLGGTARDPSTLVMDGLNTWNQVGISFDGSQAHYYINGQFSNSVIATGSHTASNGYNIPTGWRGITGVASVWQRVLKAEEVAILYMDPWAMFDRPLGLQRFIRHVPPPRYTRRMRRP